MKKSRWRRNRSRNCRKKDEETKYGGLEEEGRRRWRKKAGIRENEKEVQK